MGRPLVCFFVTAGLLGSTPGWAQTQDPSVPPPPPMPAPATECFPACRSGFFCSQGQCYSACNPPCAAGDECNPSGQCVPAGRPSDAPVGPAEPEGPLVTPDGDGVTAPRGFLYETHRRRGLLIAGSVLLGVSYLISLAYGGLAYAVFNNDGRWLIFAVPVLGPIIGQGAISTSYGRGGYNPAGATSDWLLAAIGTITQAAGLTMGIFGFLPTQELVRDRSYREYDSSRPYRAPVRVSLAPFAPGAALGLSLLIEN